MRAASLADLDEITSLGIASLHDDPIWPYRFPKAKQYHDDHIKYSRIRFSEYLENAESGVYAAMVVEAPSKEDASKKKIIAMSMWCLPGYHLPKSDASVQVKKPSDHPERRDADPARMVEFRNQIGQAKKNWFDQVYGDKQLNLMILATHPDYRRLGAAAKLVKWGQDKAKTEQATVTLFSSPMGYPLYSKVGFTVVGTVHVQVEEDDAFIDLPAMVWKP
ncbi:hypothetical protein O1611_g10213 [Lasiodiplodia mahajangana]|uniref:Uncharacterized protein n=1 Tax=Lasiodiplodia mahajangana TaxID=1108764 RepID=A0ACC2J0Z9_9PEZI|nr:hypothetical protein O1611_g10213 [Lasiodiplodia mahajangana]